MDRVDTGSTPDIPVRPFARAKGKYTDGEGAEHVEDWRPPELPYPMPAELRLPLEYNHGGKPANGPGPTEDTCRAIERMVINGSSVAAAKTLAGLTKMRWGEWNRLSREGKQPFTTFMARVSMARAHVEATCTTVIRSAAVHPDPDVAVRAAVKTLEQQFPAKYSPQTRNKTDITVRGSVKLQADVSLLAQFSVEDVEKLLLARGSDQPPRRLVAGHVVDLVETTYGAGESDADEP